MDKIREAFESQRSYRAEDWKPFEAGYKTGAESMQERIKWLEQWRDDSQCEIQSMQEENKRLREALQMGYDMENGDRLRDTVEFLAAAEQALNRKEGE